MVTRRELSALLEINIRTVGKLEAEGLPVAERGRGGRPNRYDVRTCRAWLAARNRAAQQPGAALLVRERARKERAQAALGEQTYLVRARELLPLEDVERQWAGTLSALRSAILSTGPTHADAIHRAATLEGANGVERELRNLALGIIRELEPRQSAGVTV